MPVVDIEGLGKIQFPDAMSQADIDRAIKDEILPMVALRAPSATVAGVSTDTAGTNPFSKGTAKLDGNWKVGDRYRYRVVDTLTKLVQDEGRGGGPIKEVTDREVIYTNGRTTDLLGNMIRNPRGKTFINNQVFVADYSVGRKWTTVFRATRPDDSEDEWTLDMKVVTRESVTVPAGTFNAFKVEGRGFMRDKGARVEVNYWIAPEKVRSFLAYEYLTRKGSRFRHSERHELVDFRQR